MEAISSASNNPSSVTGAVARSVQDGEFATTGLDQTQRVNPQQATTTKEQVEGATKKLQDFVSSVRGDIQFSTDQDSGETVVKVVDRSNQEVLMQLPSKEALEIAKALDKFQGLLVKQKA